MSTILPGLCSVTFRDLPPADIISIAAETGIAGIEWGADIHVPVGDLERAGDVAARSADAGVACASYGTYLGARGPIDDRSTVAAACETAAALGTTNLRVWAPLGDDPNVDDGRRATITDGLRLAADVAADHAMTIGLEFHARTLTETADSARRLMAEIGTPNAFGYWQPNLWTTTPHDTAGHVEELRSVRPTLSHLHTFWWLAGGERLPLAAGAHLWPTIIAEAEATTNGWSGPRYAFLEFVVGDDPAALRRDAATLLGWLAA